MRHDENSPHKISKKPGICIPFDIIRYLHVLGKLKFSALVYSYRNGLFNPQVSHRIK